MKNLTCLVFGLLFLLTQIIQAQKASDNIVVDTVFIGNVDEIGFVKPVVENEILLRYYFYPNLDAYFDFDTEEFIYKEAGKWIRSIHISSIYRGYSAYNTYHVEILDYFGDAPYDNLASNRLSFPQYTKGSKTKLKNNSGVLLTINSD